MKFICFESSLYKKYNSNKNINSTMHICWVLKEFKLISGISGSFKISNAINFNCKTKFSQKNKLQDNIDNVLQMYKLKIMFLLL